jgi:hypothetical protein
VRAHGDTKPRRACRRRSPRTRFVVAPAPAPPAAATTTTAAAATAAAAAVAPTCIALGVATRARSAKGRASKLPLFRILLPSLLETIETGAASPERFEVHVGHDDDDPWWGVPRNRANAAALAARTTRGHAVSVRFSSHSGAQGAPCFVWSSLFNRSCGGGCDYYYQINDDIRLSTRGWATELVSTLRANPYVPNLGVTGPLDTNNPRLMTQS